MNSGSPIFHLFNISFVFIGHNNDGKYLKYDFKTRVLGGTQAWKFSTLSTFITGGVISHDFKAETGDGRNKSLFHGCTQLTKVHKFRDFFLTLLCSRDFQRVLSVQQTEIADYLQNENYQRKPFILFAKFPRAANSFSSPAVSYLYSTGTDTGAR